MSAVPHLTTGFHTIEDLERLSAEGYRYELIEGELRQTSPPGEEHGWVGQRIGAFATVFVEERDLGRTYLAKTGFVLEADPPTVLAPDWAFLSQERASEPVRRGFGRIIPDLVLEVRSPSERPREVEEKVRLWIGAGVRVVWVCEPVQHTLTVYCADQDAVVLSASDTLREEELLPGFELPLSRVFR